VNEWGKTGILSTQLPRPDSQDHSRRRMHSGACNCPLYVQMPGSLYILGVEANKSSAARQRRLVVERRSLVIGLCMARFEQTWSGRKETADHSDIDLQAANSQRWGAHSQQRELRDRRVARPTRPLAVPRGRPGAATPNAATIHSRIINCALERRRQSSVLWGPTRDNQSS